jgi:hypothetical protein
MSSPEEAVFLYRIESARQYVSALHTSFTFEWLDQYYQYQRGCLSTERAMALLHPGHYQAYFSGSEDPRGKRTFPSAEFHDACQAQLVWRYPCPLTDQEPKVSDHIFPWSLGGPTVAQNRVMLCRWHNEVKAGDVHLFPWEEGVPRWVNRLIDRIAARVQRVASS